MSHASPVPAQPVLAGATPAGPSVGVMWVNAVLSWSLLPALILLYLTVRNIRWATHHGRPWLRYALPALCVVAVLVLLLIVASALPEPTQTSPFGDVGY